MANELRFIKGSSANWTSLEKSADNVYFVLNDDNTIDVYMGEVLLSKGTMVADLLAEIERAKAAEEALNQAIEDEKDARLEQDIVVMTNVANIRKNLEAADDALSERIQANTDDIEVLNGDVDVQGSVRQIVNDAVVALVDAAPEAFDTLKEIAEWIASDKTLSADLLAKIEANTKAINAEADTARANEATLQSNIDAANQAITAEQARAEDAEKVLTDNLTAESDRAKLAEQALTDDLAAEVKRSTDEDASIRTDFANADAVNLQTAKDYTDELEDKVDKHVVDFNNTVTSINTAISTLSSSLSAAITAEQERAVAAEQALETKIDTDIAAEQERAEAVETALDEAITAEADRAKAAEETLSNSLNAAIAAEQERAIDAEKVLTDDLAAEVEQRKAMKGSGNVVVELAEDGVQTVKLEWLTF